MTEAPFLQSVPSAGKRLGEVVDWHCRKCDGTVLIPAWVSPLRVNGVLTDGAMHWCCMRCLMAGRFEPVTGPGADPPDLPKF